MRIEFDPAKRAATLEARGLDMADADEVFAGTTVTSDDDRQDYDEPRKITVGFMSGRMVVLVWTPRGAVRRIVSLRKANEREQKLFGPRLG
ncbi:BrnT family toxin [uncultured Amaricoccus sp.]|uniref:BrnT family toxin n=1 Tax=uncultured Amaricoccus sp. TaxID=339341 RepID=UPI00261370AE|nr:BrnT family toxin [uncultured Amaricoccus sp.]